MTAPEILLWVALGSLTVVTLAAASVACLALLLLGEVIRDRIARYRRRQDYLRG